MNKKISENLALVRERIEKAAERAGRESGAVRLLLATKNREPGLVQVAVDAGAGILGENRVQEMLAKMGEVEGPAEWHFIGHLQRNKARSIVGVVRLIHSVDSVRLALEIESRAEKAGVVQPVLVQVNVAGEKSKFGLEPAGVERLLEEIADCRNIEVRGLSTIAPLVTDPEEVRWVFRDLKKLADTLEGSVSGFRCRELSMGMTNDFEVAVEEGSTVVRLGTAVFGRLERSEGRD